jgi:hypothetical protein
MDITLLEKVCLKRNPNLFLAPLGIKKKDNMNIGKLVKIELTNTKWPS